MSQNPFPSCGASKGQSPISFREQTIGPKVRNPKDNQRAKCKGSAMGKMKGKANHSCGESNASEAIVGEEWGCRVMFSTQSTGSSGDKNTKPDLSREERSILKDTEGSQIEEKESASCALDQTPTSEKDTKESLFSVDLGVGREEDDSYVGEKMQCHNPVLEDLSGISNNLGYKVQVGRKIIRSPNTSEEITSGIGFEAEGEGDTRTGRRVRPDGERQGKEEGTCPVSSGSVW